MHINGCRTSSDPDCGRSATRFDTLINGVRAVNEVQSTAVAEEKIRCIVGRACLSKRQTPTIQVERAAVCDRYLGIIISARKIVGRSVDS